MAKHLIILTLILLTSCGTPSDPGYALPTEEFETAPTGPTTRNNTLTTPTPVTMDEEEELPVDWRSKSGATFLVSDGRQAARFYLPEGENVVLPMIIPVNITVLGVDTDKVFLRINKEELFINLKEDKTIGEYIIINVREIIKK